MAPKKAKRGGGRESEGAAAADAPAQSSSSATSQAIQALIKVDPRPDAYLALMELGTKELPTDLSLKDLDQQCASGTSCFSLESSPCTWSSHKICQRCELINQLFQASSAHRTKSVTRIHLATAILTTDCISDNVRKGVIPELSQELQDLIVDFAIQGMVETQDGRAVCALMHVSSLFRLRVVKAFESVAVFESQYVPFDESWLAINLERSMGTFVADVIFWWSLDVSLRRHKFTEPIPPGTDRILRTTSGLYVAEMIWYIVIDDVAWDPAGGDEEEEEDKPEYWGESVVGQRVQDRTGDRFRPLSSRDCAQELLRLARSATIPRKLSVFDRARSGTLQAPSIGTYLEPQVYFYPTEPGATVESNLITHGSYKGPDVQQAARSWRFDTVELRDDAV